MAWLAALWDCHKVPSCGAEGTPWRRGQQRLDGGLGLHRPGVTKEGAGALQRDGGRVPTQRPSHPDPLCEGELLGVPPHVWLRVPGSPRSC